MQSQIPELLSRSEGDRLTLQELLVLDLLKQTCTFLVQDNAVMEKVPERAVEEFSDLIVFTLSFYESVGILVF